MSVLPKLVVRPLRRTASATLALRIEFEDKVVSFSGNAGWMETLIDVARSADLFIRECQSSEPHAFQHLDWKALQAREKSLKARRILLTHMSEPMLDRVLISTPAGSNLPWMV